MKDQLIIGSYNLRTPGGNDPSPNDWESRMPRIRADVKRMGYHIFGSQETVDFYTPHICERTSFAAIGHGRCEKSDGEACHIYYDTSRLEVLEHETFWLSATPERFSIVPGAIYPRICTVGVFADKVTGKRLVFANTHLEHRVKELQKVQLEYLFKRLDEKYSSFPQVLTGDLNAYPDSPAAEYASGKLRDAFRVSEKAVEYAGPTYHGFVSDPARRLHKERIDYIFVSETVRVEAFETVENFCGENIASSDHFPLRAVISC